MIGISVIIPSFNRAKTLKRAIDSVLAQTHMDFELIVVDDASTDETRELLESQQDPRLKAIYLPNNKGVSHARNRGIQQAKYEWLAFLDSDDEWLPGKLEAQFNKLKTFPKLKVIHTEEIWIRNSVRVNPKHKHKKYEGSIFDKCIPLCCMSPSSIMIHKDVLKDCGLFNEDFPVCEDYELWLKICANYEVGFVETAQLKKYGGHEDQLSTKYFAMDYWRIKALWPHLDSPQVSEANQKLVKETIIAKADILLAGYKKHNNLENYQEVFDLRSKLL